MALRCTLSSTEYLTISSGLLDHNSTYSVGGWFLAVSLGGGNQLIWNAMSTTRDFTDFDAIFISGDGNLRSAVFQNGGGSQGDNGTVITTGVWNHIMLVRESATSFRVYLNGVTDTVNTTDISGRAATAYMHLSTYYEGGTAQQGFDGRFFGWKAWQRALTAADVSAEMRQAMPVSAASLYGVWPFLAGATRAIDFSGKAHDWTEVNTPSDEDPPNVAFSGEEPIFEFATSGAAFTLVASSGSFTETGTTTGLKASRQIVAGIGSFTETGIATALRAARRLVLTGGDGSGSFGLTGISAALRAARDVVAGSGTFSLAGTDPTLHHGRTMPAGSGSFSVTGTDVTVLLTRRITPASGTFTFTGTAVTLVSDQGARIVVDSGEFLLTGTNVTLTPSEIVTAVRTYGNWSVAWVIPAGSDWRILCSIDSCDNPKIRVVAQMKEFPGIVQRPLR